MIGHENVELSVVDKLRAKQLGEELMKMLVASNAPRNTWLTLSIELKRMEDGGLLLTNPSAVPHKQRA